MSGISKYLKAGKDYEIIHQLVLYILLKDSSFVKILLELDIPNPYSFWEHKRGLFDLGVGIDQHAPVALIELKVGAGLSPEQLEKQSNYLAKHKVKGFHILLGTTDYEYVKNNYIDDITSRSNNTSKKIGFKELISSLELYMGSMKLPEDDLDLVSNYCDTLKSQRDYLT